MHNIQKIKITKEIINNKEYYVVPALVFQNKENQTTRKIPHPHGSGIMQFDSLEKATEAVNLAGFVPILPSGKEVIQNKIEINDTNLKDVIKTKLLKMIDDENSQVQANAIYALGEIKDTSLIPIFMEKIGHDNETIRTNAINAILNFGQYTTKEIIEALNDSNWVKRMSAITIIEKLVLNEIVPAEIFIDSLLKRFEDTNNIVKCCAISTLGKIYKNL